MCVLPAQHAMCCVRLSFRRHFTALVLKSWLLLGFIISLCSPKSKQMRLSYLSQYAHQRTKQCGGGGREDRGDASLCVTTLGKAGQNFP